MSLETTKGMEKVNVSGLFGGTTPDAEKPALKSKKFVAFLITELGFFTLMGLMLFKQDVDKIGSNTAFMSLAFTAAFMGIGYTLGQSYIDKFVRVATITKGHEHRHEHHHEHHEPEGDQG